jgi:hypothetical protein
MFFVEPYILCVVGLKTICHGQQLDYVYTVYICILIFRG